ncbi:MAG: NrfD/PsrC family molybdoenzyme membrane anchor subunit, partial [Candidatus Bathyarchaeia archaeon]
MRAKGQELLTPITRTTGAFWAILVILLIGVSLWLYAWGTQLTHGLIVTGMRDIGVGPPWGLYLSNFIFFIGISHAGIAISAAVRIAKLKRYKPVARIAELLTVLGLLMAMLMVITDLGRPDRIFIVILRFPER